MMNEGMKFVIFCLVAVTLMVTGISVTGCTTSAPPVQQPVTTVPTPVPAPATAVPLADAALSGPWTLKGGIIGTSPFIPNADLTITFRNDGTFTGFTGCNNYQGSYKLTGQTTEFGKTIELGPIASTQKYCADTSNLETSYLKVLQGTVSYSITNDNMLLRTAAQNQLSYRRGYP